MNTGRIYKSKQAGNFTVIPNAILEDRRLGLKEIGLLCYILKLPPDWALNKTQLYKNLNSGRDQVINAFNQLEETGYIVKRKVRGKAGHFAGYDYEVFDTPQRETRNPENQETDAPTTGKPETVTPKTDNALLIKTNNKKTVLTKVPFPTETGPNDNGQLNDGEPDPQAAGAEKPYKSTSHTDFIAVYDKWFKDMHDGTPPQYDNGNAKAVGPIIKYFRKIAAERATKDKLILDAAGVDAKALEGWQYVLNNWEKLDSFLQAKTRLVDINSNIQNIITQIKNGHSKKGTAKPTGGNVSASDLAGTIAKHYNTAGGGTGPGQTPRP